MSDFKTGDKVVCIKGCRGECIPQAGCVYTVMIVVQPYRIKYVILEEIEGLWPIGRFEALPNRKTALERVVEEMRKRQVMGLDKYGCTVDRNDLSSKEWLQHLKEELMDGVLYVQRAIDTLEKLEGTK